MDSRDWPTSICHLIASGFAGGPEKQILALSTRLIAGGQAVAVGSFRENRPSVEVVDRARELGLPTFLIETRSPFSPWAVTQLSRFLAEAKVELLVTHGYKSNLIGYLATRRSSVVQVPMIRGYTWEDRKVRLYESVDRRLLRRFRNLMCVSEGTRQLLIGFGIQPDRIHVLHNAVDSDRSVESVDLRAELGLPRDVRLVVAAGRLSPEKGHRFLVEAMEQLTKRLPEACAVILGAGPEEGRLRQQIENAGLEKKVFLAGFRRDVLGCLAAADAVVNPSLTEGLPNVVLEAMALGAPVVATDVGGVSELVAHRETGWLLDAGDPTALANSIEEALRHPDTARDCARRARERVEETFSFPSQVRRFHELCKRIQEGEARS